MSEAIPMKLIMRKKMQIQSPLVPKATVKVLFGPKVHQIIPLL